MKTLSDILREFREDSKVYQEAQYQINKMFDKADYTHCGFCGFSVELMEDFITKVITEVVESVPSEIEILSPEQIVQPLHRPSLTDRIEAWKSEIMK